VLDRERAGSTSSTEPPDVGGRKRRERSPAFLSMAVVRVSVVGMGVLDRAKEVSGFAADTQPSPFVCLDCETPLDVQHHTCPVCESFDVRREKWIR
jgi:hypothetical protein